MRLVFAKTLSSAIREEALRKYIHAKMQKRLASKVEMVYIAEKSKVIYGGKTLAQILTEYADKETLEKYGKDFFNTITDIVPLLTIAMPTTEKWDASNWQESYIPNVAAVLELSTNNSDDCKTFREGTEVQIALRSSDPNDPTLTVWNAEITYLINLRGFTPSGVNINSLMPGKNTGELTLRFSCDIAYQTALSMLDAYFVTGDVYYLAQHDDLIVVYNNCLNNTGASSSGPTACTEPCERDCEVLDETLVDFKINGWGVYTNIRRNWFEDYFVFHGYIVGATRNSLNGAVQGFDAKIVTGSYTKSDLMFCTGSCVGRFKNENFFIRPDWKLSEFGDNYKITWSEVDDGSTTTTVSVPIAIKFKVKVPVIGETEISEGVTVSHQKQIGPVVELGSQNVFYCQTINRENNIMRPLNWTKND